MDKTEFKRRTKELAIDIARFTGILPYNAVNQVYIRQIIRCSSSVGANYRAACRAKSTADFIYKLKIVEEEADETMFFLELLQELNPDPEKIIPKLHSEYGEILAMTVASIRTLQSKKFR